MHAGEVQAEATEADLQKKSNKKRKKKKGTVEE